MNDHSFKMRLNCAYVDPDNSIDQLEVETLIDDEWQRLDLNTRAPGFQLFIYALFSCQHLYFRLNAAEHGLMLTSSEGSITVTADANWHIKLLHVEFNGWLKNGTPTQRDIDYIIERMGQCPVSCNIKNIPDSKKVITFTQ